ncbi:MAG: alpha-(1-_3)-arabinofuranosyltransferase, partial [Actinomycetota bacterium]|nr:alpha-(1->3)-arabinofuranosyltransferase [Actinomycetota bacterium]
MEPGSGAAQALSTAVMSALRPTARPAGKTPRWAVLAPAVALVAVCFAQEPGRLAADTKLDLSVNPVSFLLRGLQLWDPASGFGHVEDQVQGYLLPMGPFFTIGHAAHLPPWIVQRAWMGLLLAVAYVGLLRLADALDIGRPGARLVGGLAYALSPQMLAMLGPISANVLSSSLLPWVLLYLVRGSTTGSPRRAAAASAVAVALMGGANAASTLAVLVLPGLWLLTRAPGPRRRSLTGWWLAGVVLATSWWLVPLVIEGRYAFSFLPYIEQASNTTATTSATEVLRGTAHWLDFFTYRGQPWWPGANVLIAAPAAVLASGVLAAAGLAGLAHGRLAERRVLALSMLAGLAVMAAGYAGALGGPWAQAARTLLDGPLVAFRNVHKFEPLVRLPLALGLVHVVALLTRESRQERRLVGAVLVVAVAGTALPVLQGQLLARGSFARVPAYWSQAAAWLGHHAGRQESLLLPGSGFPDYVWGRPTDEPLQALATSPWAVRDQAPLGGNGSTLVIDAVDQRLVAGLPIPGLAPFLARAGVRYLVVRNDLDWVRAGAPDPARVAAVLGASPGIGLVARFGPERTPEAPPIGTPTAAERQARPAVQIYQVDGNAGPVVAYPAATTTVLSGGPQGLLALADRGALAGTGLVVLAGQAGPGLGSPARSVVTDSSTRRAVNFGAIYDGASYVLGARGGPAGGGPVHQRLAVAGVAHQTVAVAQGSGGEGPVTVRASSYATAVAPHPENQPMAAFDGDPATAWESGSAGSSDGQWVELDLGRRRSFGSVTISLLDPPGGPLPGRLVLTTDAGSRTVSPAATAAPQTFRLPPGPTRRLRVTLGAVRGEATSATSFSRAGLSDIALPGLTVTPLLQVPADETGPFSKPGAPPPMYLFDRLRTAQPLRVSEEDRLDRRFEVPQRASFTLTGTASGPPGPPGACGQGPVVTVDGAPVPTQVTTGPGPPSEVPFATCAPVELAGGPHQVETDPRASLAVDSLTLAADSAPSPPVPARAVTVRRWAGSSGRVRVGPGPGAVLATSGNFNPGWTASLAGRRLAPLEVDGWRQAWAIPAGAGGAVTISYAPNRALHAALLAGAAGVIAVVGLALAPAGRRRRRARPAHRLMAHPPP